MFAFADPRLAGLTDAPELLGLVALLGVFWLVRGVRRPTADGRARAVGVSGDLVGACQQLASMNETGPLLRAFAREVRERGDFARVVVRMHNARAELFEARAFAGLDETEVARVSTQDVAVERIEVWEREAEKRADVWWLTGIEDELGTGERLLIPLRDEKATIVGYVEALPASDDVEPTALSLLAAAAASGARAARLRTMLQRRELEYTVVSEQLREAQGLRDNFVSNVSHELRTPLTSVKAYAETLARGIDDMPPETRREFVAVIEHEAERLDQVFDDLLDVAHLEGRAHRVARDRVELRTLVCDVATVRLPDFVESGIDLRVFAPDGPVYVQGDAQGLRQVLEHVLDNARKFTPGGGCVRVNVREEAASAFVVVEDTGIGIPETELPRVFERFYQVDGSATRTYGGQGLGLSLCRDIVGWHHGRIHAEAGADDGTRIVIQLPVRGLVVRQVGDEDVVDAVERLQWESFLKLGIHLVGDLVGTRVASIMLVDPLHRVLRVDAAVGLDEDTVQNTMLGHDEGVAGHVWSTGRSVLVPDLDQDERFAGLADDKTYPYRSLLSVPMLRDDEVVGVLNVNTKYDGTPFDDDDRLLLEAIARRLTIALDHFERYRDSYARLSSVENGVRAMLDVGRERQTAVRDLLSGLGLRTGRRIGLDEDHLRSLAYAIRTYDLGLSEVSGRILRKSTPLSADERERVDDHARLGCELVADLEPSSQVRKMILHHHENFDGSGYPDGLGGEAIPVGARIVRLVDVLAALLHERPFREALSLENALDEIAAGAGRETCPRITPVFLEVVREDAAAIETLLTPAPDATSVEIELGSSPTVN